MKRKIVNLWIYGNLIILTWILGLTGIYLFGKNQNVLLAILIILAIPLLWGSILLSTTKKILLEVSYEQLKKLSNFSISLFFAASLMLSFIVMLTPSDPRLRGDYFFWEQLIAFGSLGLSLMFFIFLWNYWRKVQRI